MSTFVFNQFREYVWRQNWIPSKENFFKFLVIECIQELYLNRDIVERIKDDNFEIFYTKDGFVLLTTFNQDTSDLIVLISSQKQIPFESEARLSFADIKIAMEEIRARYKDTYLTDFSETNIKIYVLFLDPQDKILKNSLTHLKKYQVSSINEKILKDGLSYKNDEEENLGKTYKLELAGSRSNLLTLSIPNMYDLVIAPIYAKSLASIWEQSSGKVLDKNLRLYIKDNKIDNAIKKSLIDHSKEFVVYNNGVTIVSEDSALNHDGNFLKFSDFHIINGGQTTKLIFDVFNSFKEIKNWNQINDAIVLVKIILFKNKKNSDKTINRITKATNQQKKIETQDFLANDRTLLAWGEKFNEFFRTNNLTFSVKRDDNLPKGFTTIKLWDFIELVVSTFWWEPHMLKGAKKNSVFNNEGREILKTFNYLKVEDKGTRAFIYDLWFINKTIQERESNIKKNTKRTSKTYERNMALAKILHSGRFLILNIIFALFIFHNTKDINSETLLETLNSNSLSTNDKIARLSTFSKNFKLRAILDRGKNHSYQKIDYIPEETERNLTTAIIQLSREILKKFENSVTDLNWGGLGNSFGDSTRNLNILKDSVNQFLVEENDVLDPVEPYVKSFKESFNSVED